MNDKEGQGKQAEEQNSRKSSVDKINNIVDKSRSAYNKAKTAKKIYKNVKRARTGMVLAETAVEAGVAFAPFILFILVIIGIIILVSVIISLFAGNAKGGEPPPPADCTTISGSCQPSSCTSPLVADTTGAVCTGADAGKVCCVAQRQCTTIGGTCSTEATCVDVPNSLPDTTSAICNDPSNPTKTTCCVPKSTLVCDPNDPVKSLKDNFNVTVNNVDVAGKTLLDYICNTYRIAFTGHPHYLSLFKSRGSVFYFTNAAGDHGQYATTNGDGSIIFYKGFLSQSTPEFQKHIIIHESGHVVAGADNSLQDNFYNQTYNAGVDLACFNQFGVLKTYPNNQPVSISFRVNESFAEALADTLTCPASGTCPASSSTASDIPDFPQTCSNIYTYITTKVL